MLGKEYANQECSAAKALELIGERWSLLIMRDSMFAGLTRFSQFEKSLGIASNILSRRLEGFVDAGLMEKRLGVDNQAEYALTRKGLELMPVIVALTEWGDKWLEAGPAAFKDGRDSTPVELRLSRVEDGTQIDVANVIARRRTSSE